MEIVSKIFLTVTWTTGGKHYLLPWTTGGDTLCRPRQQGRSLCANPDVGESIKSSLPPHCMKKYFKKVHTTNH